jgi:RimJ/RimL family protein N-acetyltransferase
LKLTVPTTYAIRVDGHLDDHWSGWFGGLGLTRNSDGTSTLTATIADQAQLHGLLAGLRDIGATLLDLSATECAPAPDRRPVLERPLHTQRLTLRPARAEDADPTWGYRQLDPVNEWLIGRPADIVARRDHFTDPARLASTVVIVLGHDPSAEVIGDFLLRRRDAWAQSEVSGQTRDAEAELGGVLDPAHSGHGYATEAVRELLRYSVEDLGLRRITATCFLDNDASWRLMESVGMRREAHAVRASLHRSGRWLDTVTYALLADER